MDMVDPFAEFVGTFHYERRQNLIRYMLAFDATPKGKKEIVALLNKHGMARSEAWKALLEAEEYLRHHQFIPRDVKISPFVAFLGGADLTGTLSAEIRRSVKKVLGRAISKNEQEEIISTIDSQDWNLLPLDFFKGT